MLRLTPAANLKLLLPQEEKLLLDEMLSHRRRKGMKVNMLDGRMAVIVSEMADFLRREALGMSFKDNRTLLIIGTMLSAIAILVAARPRWPEQWFALGISFAFMAPSAYYLPFLLLRLRDLYRTAHDKLDGQVFRRAVLLAAWIVPCIAGITLGFVELGGTFGWPVLEATAVMAIVDVSFVHFMRTTTEEGRKLLYKVEGFRLFLQESWISFPWISSQLRMSTQEFTKSSSPIAVALEVEQAWCNRFLAIASTFHQPEPFPNTQSFYLGMWDGKPVEIVYRPLPK